MRWTGLTTCVVASIAWASTAAAAPRASNPAFLGIQMQDAGGHGPCMIEIATRDGPAEAAGLRGGDIVISVDKKPTATCNALLDEITAHEPGDMIDLKVQRLGAALAVKVQLTTRDALLHKVIGKPVVATSFGAVDGSTTYDLSALHGTVVIVGLYHPGCGDCASLFTKFLDWSRDKARKGMPQPLVLAVTLGAQLHDLLALQSTLDVPLATDDSTLFDLNTDRSLFSREMVLADRDRLGVIVIDGHGIVQYVGPIAPNSDDTEAVLDELFAVADQASRRSK